MDLSGEIKIENSEEAPVFTSSDEAVATVSESGVLTALSAGQTTVKAIVEGKEASAVVKVAALVLESISLNGPESLVEGADWQNVVATLKPVGYSAENLEWTFTPSDEELGFSSEKVSADTYKVKVAAYKEGGNVVVKVKDKNSEVAQTLTIEVKKAAGTGVAAERITLDAPKSLTESTETWGLVTVKVQPEGYDPSNLSWEFTPSDEQLGFESEKVDDLSYKVRFKAYKAGGKVEVKVTDLVGSMYALREITVDKKPAEGVVSISLSPPSLDLYVGGEPVDLKVSTTPEVYDASLLIWTSSDESVVKVVNGKVIVVGAGEAVVKVKDSISGKTAECSVTVKEPVTDVAVKSIVLDQTSVEMEVGGESVQLKASCYDEKGNLVEDFSGLTWSASLDIDDKNLDVKVVEVSQQGVISPVAEGFSTVTVCVSSNTVVKATCSVTVNPKKLQVEKVVIPSSMTISVGGTFDLNARVEPEEVQDKSLKYSSSDETVATVDQNGTVTAVALGEAVITATASNGVKAQCQVTVANQYIDLGAAKITLIYGDTYTFVPKKMPSGETGMEVTWTSSDPEVASVDNTGKIKGLKEGETVITATTADGITGSCTVIVEYDFEIKLTIPDEPASGNPTLHQFEELRINVAYTNGYVPSKVEWICSDTELVKVTEYEGYVMVEAVYEGIIDTYDNKTVTITHRVGSRSSSKTIQILPAQPKEIVISNLPDDKHLKFYLGDKLDLDVKVLPEQAPQDVTFWGPGAGLFDGYNVARRTGESQALGINASDTEIGTTIYITVLPKTVESGSLTREHVAIEEGKSTLVKVNFVPANDENYDYTTVWESADETVATVKDGKITAVGIGETEVTATIGNGQVLTCEVAVVEAVPSTVKVGDYFYADGRTSEYNNVEGWGEVIGIVFSTVSPVDEGDDMLLEDHADCTHGLVVALEDTAVDIKWQTNSTDVDAWLAENQDYRNLTDLELLNGYSNTKMLRLYNESNPDNKVNIVDQTPAVTLPEGTSGWYVPSYAELAKLYENKEVIQTNISEVGGKPFATEKTFHNGSYESPCYWSSTEMATSSSYAGVFNFNDGMLNNRMKTKDYYLVRHIFAF